MKLIQEIKSIKYQLRQKYDPDLLIRLYNLIDKLLTDDQWESIGYDSIQPCQICGHKGNNKCDPRFGYTVCREHSYMTPLEISNASRTE